MNQPCTMRPLTHAPLRSEVSSFLVQGRTFSNFARAQLHPARIGYRPPTGKAHSVTIARQTKCSSSTSSPTISRHQRCSISTPHFPNPPHLTITQSPNYDARLASLPEYQQSLNLRY